MVKRGKTPCRISVKHVAFAGVLIASSRQRHLALHIHNDHHLAHVAQLQSEESKMEPEILFSSMKSR